MRFTDEQFLALVGRIYDHRAGKVDDPELAADALAMLASVMASPTSPEVRWALLDKLDRYHSTVLLNLEKCLQNVGAMGSSSCALQIVEKGLKLIQVWLYFDYVSLDCQTINFLYHSGMLVGAVLPTTAGYVGKSMLVARSLFDILRIYVCRTCAYLFDQRNSQDLPKIGRAFTRACYYLKCDRCSDLYFSDLIRLYDTRYSAGIEPHIHLLWYGLEYRINEITHVPLRTKLWDFYNQAESMAVPGAVNIQLMAMASVHSVLCKAEGFQKKLVVSKNYLAKFLCGMSTVRHFRGHTKIVEDGPLPVARMKKRARILEKKRRDSFTQEEREVSSLHSRESYSHQADVIVDIITPMLLKVEASVPFPDLEVRLYSRDTLAGWQ